MLTLWKEIEMNATCLALRCSCVLSLIAIPCLDVVEILEIFIRGLNPYSLANIMLNLKTHLLIMLHVSVEWLISKHYWIQYAFASIDTILPSKYYSCFLKNLCHSTFHFNVTRYPFANLSNKDAAIGKNFLACFFFFTFRWLSTCLTIKQFLANYHCVPFLSHYWNDEIVINFENVPECFVITWTQTLKCFHRNIKYFCFFR